MNYRDCCNFNKEIEMCNCGVPCCHDIEDPCEYYGVQLEFDSIATKSESKLVKVINKEYDIK